MANRAKPGRRPARQAPAHPDLGEFTLERLAERLSTERLSTIGASSRVWLDAVSRRLEIDIDDLAILVARRPLEGARTTFDHYVWTIYSDEIQTLLKQIPGRWWNPSLTATCFECSRCDGQAALIDRLRPGFKRILLVEDGRHTVHMGTSTSSPVVFHIKDGLVATISYPSVLDDHKALMPSDVATSISLHMVKDEEYRALYSRFVRVDYAGFSQIGFETTHRWMLFKIRVKDGGLRYLWLDAEGKTVRLLFDGSPELAKAMAVMRTAAWKTKAPIIGTPLWPAAAPPQGGGSGIPADSAAAIPEGSDDV